MSAKLDVVQSDADRQRFVQMPDAFLVGYGGIGQRVAKKSKNSKKYSILLGINHFDGTICRKQVSKGISESITGLHLC